MASPRSPSKRYPDPDAVLAKIDAKRRRTAAASNGRTSAGVIAGARADLEASRATRRRIEADMSARRRTPRSR